jgi:hypothetical protein
LGQPLFRPQNNNVLLEYVIIWESRNVYNRDMSLFKVLLIKKEFYATSTICAPFFPFYAKQKNIYAPSSICTVFPMYIGLHGLLK